MSRRLLPLALAALALSIAAGCADDVSPAVQVDDVKISDDELMDEVEEWAGNPQAVDPAQLADQPPGTYPQGLVGAIIQQRIDITLHDQKFDELELELTDEARAQAIDLIFRGDVALAEQVLAGFSDEFGERWLDDISKQIAIETELGEEAYVAWRTEALSEAEIEVSPRYGAWDPESGQVIPPDGPVQPAPSVAPLQP